MNMHFTGLNDLYFGNGRPEEFDILLDRSWKSVKEAHARAFRKWAPYYLKNYVFFPLLAGPMFWKVLLGNWMAETMRDLYSAATIYCGHVGEDVAAYEEGRARTAAASGTPCRSSPPTTSRSACLSPSSAAGSTGRSSTTSSLASRPTACARSRPRSAPLRGARHRLPHRELGSTLKKALAHVRALGFRDFARTMA